METIIWIASYLVVINIVGFLIMGIDKSKAKNHSWRISESSLFFVALIFGSLGCVIGMQVFRHKTKHWYFKWGMPLILLIQIAIVTFILCYPGWNISIM
ncbi:MAG: DUF1294 domain-containing protein [Lachnospiraceae bacterium]|nr:DUF1294 domain-containing protein [Lachnospiraceae bacterium]